MKLFPLIRPYMKGYFAVGDGHELHYELCGNPKGRPVLYVHGGPGVGCTKDSRRYFNPRKWNIILFDQRGAGRSRPFASTEHNTTQKLAEDIRKLLAFLHIKKVFLFGGSWGSTLSLAYAVKYPKTVSGMLLRGIYLATLKETMWLFGGGTQDFFPEAWERFTAMVPKQQRQQLIRYYVKKMGSANKKVAERYAREWARYELSLLRLQMSEKDVLKALKKYNYRSFAKIEAHYMLHDCFMPEGYLVKRLQRLRSIPLTIVHGRYDVICPPGAAWLLHQKLPKSKLLFVIAGHSSDDPPLRNALLEEMKRFER